MNYTTRIACIFCKKNELSEIFPEDYSFPIGNFTVSDPNYTFIYIPYNIQLCTHCGTAQTKYEGDLSLIYGNNYANFYGSIRGTMNELFADFITSTQPKGVIEIGAGSGALADIIISKVENIKYHIVDPSYGGNIDNKIVHSSYFEDFNINSSAQDADIIVMSHCFEHFYDPTKIIENIALSPSISRVYISVPDFENYLMNGTYHVLNPEHTFYVENRFIEQLFQNVGFRLARVCNHQNHSVFFEFIRTNDGLPFIQPKNINSKMMVTKFFQDAINKINYAIKHTAEDAKCYVWPCSMHTLFCGTLGLPLSKCSAVLDNSPHKIGKYLYGYGLICKSFSDFLKTEEKSVLYITGGCYNSEIMAAVNINKNITAFIV